MSKRYPLYTILVVCELIILSVTAICSSVIAVSVQKNIDYLLARPEGISKAEFRRAINLVDNDINNLQRITRGRLMEEDED
jgi:hypothetical protein